MGKKKDSERDSLPEKCELHIIKTVEQNKGEGMDEILKSYIKYAAYCLDNIFTVLL